VCFRRHDAATRARIRRRRHLGDIAADGMRDRCACQARALRRRQAPGHFRAFSPTRSPNCHCVHGAHQRRRGFARQVGTGTQQKHLVEFRRPEHLERNVGARQARCLRAIPCRASRRVGPGTAPPMRPRPAVSTSNPAPVVRLRPTRQNAASTGGKRSSYSITGWAVSAAVTDRERDGPLPDDQVIALARHTAHHNPRKRSRAGCRRTEHRPRHPRHGAALGGIDDHPGEDGLAPGTIRDHDAGGIAVRVGQHLRCRAIIQERPHRLAAARCRARVSLAWA